MQKRKKYYLAKSAAAALVLLLLYSPEAKAQVETGENIMDSVSQFGQIQYFRTLLEETGLDDKLSSDGPFTVFAPVDDAFNDLPDEVLAGLLENPDELRAVLLSHVSEGSLHSQDIAGRDNLSVISGSDLEIDHHERGISIDEALMVAADIIATNGVIHAVDKVFVP